MHTTTMRAMIVALFAAFLILGVSAAFLAHYPEGEKAALLATTTVQRRNALPFNPPRQFPLRIHRWSTLDDILWIKEVLAKHSQKELFKEMIKKEPIGHFGGHELCYAAHNRLPNGDLEVLCVTTETIDFEKLHEKEAVFSAIQVRIPKEGQASGWLYRFARFKVLDNNFCKIQTDRSPTHQVLFAEVESFVP